MTSPPPTQPAVRGRIYRSRRDRMIGGVAGGLATYLGVDPVLVRLAFVALAFAGVGVLLYIIAWIVIPEELPSAAVADSGEPAAPPQARPRPGGYGARLVVGAILVAIGTLLLADWALPDLGDFFWPAAIILLGVGLLAYGTRR